MIKNSSIDIQQNQRKNGIGENELTNQTTI